MHRGRVQVCLRARALEGEVAAGRSTRTARRGEAALILGEDDWRARELYHLFTKGRDVGVDPAQHLWKGKGEAS